VMFDSIGRSREKFLNKKSRKRRVPLIRLFLFTVGLSVLWHTVASIVQTKKISTSSASLVSIVPDQVSQIPLEHAKNLVTHIVKPGDTFFGILTKLGISGDEANDVYRSLKPLNLVLFPGDSLIVKTTQEGGIEDLSILNRFQQWYRVSSRDTLLEAERRPLQVSTYLCIVNGVLASSLSEEMQKLGVSDALTAKFADIFAWDINFFLDPRKGDTFQILFEQKYAEGRFIGYGDVLAARYTCNGKEFYAVGFPDERGKILYYDLQGRSVQKQFLKAPLRYSRISSKFSYNRRHPVLGIVRPHLGIDYAAPVGTPVYAAADGRIIFAGWKGGYGKHVEITHGASYRTLYGHLHHIGVRPGQHVRQGDCIGTVGSTGLSTGPHLDYRMSVSGRYVNPLTLSLPSGKSVETPRRDQFDAVKSSCEAAFNLRFPNEIGLHVLHIEKVPSVQPAINQVSRKPQNNAIKPNS
jgi:murein DD-endopeptidase MepM/ murein hydrolase activator NlpD